MGLLGETVSQDRRVRREQVLRERQEYQDYPACLETKEILGSRVSRENQV